MSDRDFEELAGRIEGLGRAIVIMGAMLELRGAVPLQTLQARWRVHSAALAPSLATAQMTLMELADQLLSLPGDGDRPPG